MPSSPRSPSDSDLLVKALSGDIEALGTLIEQHFGKAYAVALARLRDPEAAADLAQEVFLRVQLHLHQLGPQGNFPAWVVRIARNLAIDWQRRGLRASRLLPMVSLEKMLTDPPDPSDKGARETMARDEESQALHRAIESLSPEQREVLLLHHMEDLSQREIAEQLGVNPSTVSRQLSAARKALRHHLAPLLGEVIARSRPPRKAVARSLLIASAVGTMAGSAKTTLAASATVGQWTSAVGTAQTGMAGAVGVIGFWNSLPALIAGGAKVMATGKGIAATVVAVAAIVGGGLYHASHSNETGADTPGPSVGEETPALYPYQVTVTTDLRSGTRQVIQRSILSPGRIREERENGVFIWDEPNHPNQFLLIDSNRSLAIRTSLSDEPLYPFDVVQHLNALQDSPEEGVTIELNANTGLPNRIEIAPPGSGTRTVFSDFRFGENLPEALFSIDWPPGYQLVERGGAPRVPTEESLIEGLRAAANLSGGAFPPEYNMDWLTWWAEGLQPRISQLSEEEVAELQESEQAVRTGIRFAQYVPMQGGEFHWVGGGVQLGDGANEVAWWILPDSPARRHVVMGDLTIRVEEMEAAAAQFAPDSPEAHCRALFDALMSGDWNQAQPLFFGEASMREFAGRIGEQMMPPAQMNEMLDEQRRLFLETSDTLRAAGSVQYLGPDHLGRGQVQLPDGFDQREDVFLNILVDGQPRRLFFNVMLKMDDRWLIMDGPTLR